MDEFLRTCCNKYEDLKQTVAVNRGTQVNLVSCDDNLYVLKSYHKHTLNKSRVLFPGRGFVKLGFFYQYLLGNLGFVRQLSQGHPHLCSLVEFYESNVVIDPEGPDYGHIFIGKRPIDIVVLKVFDYGGKPSMISNGHGKFSTPDGRERYTAAEVANMLTAISDALSYIHSHQLVHGDIKPANIVIEKDVCKLCDFDMLGPTMQPGGTTFFRSPAYYEHRFGVSKEEDLRTGQREDIYALGVTAYVWLRGRLPHSSLDNVEDAMKENILDTVDLNTNVPVERVIRSLLAMNPLSKAADEMRTDGSDPAVIK